MADFNWQKKVSELEYKSIEIIQSEEQKEKEKKEEKQSLGELQGTIKTSNICIMGIPE